MRRRGSEALPALTARRLLWQEMVGVGRSALYALAVVVISVCGLLAGPILVQVFIDRAETGRHHLLPIALAYLAIAIFVAITSVLASYLSVSCAWQISDSLRRQLLQRVFVETPVLVLERSPVGDLLETIEGNADVVGRALADSGFSMVGNLAVAVGAISLIFVVVPTAGVGVVALTVLIYFVLRRLSRIAISRWELARSHAVELFGFIGDALAARNDLLLLDRTDWVKDQVQKRLGQLYAVEGRAYIFGRSFWPLTQFFIAIACGLGFGFGLRQLEGGSVSVGALTVIYLYISLLQTPLEQVSSQVGQLQEMMAVLGVIARQFSDIHGGVSSLPTEPRLRPGALDIRCESVSFGYTETPVLKDVNFEVAPGRSLGIVGRTGAGKSTIINLLCGLEAPGSGRVLIGGVPADELSSQEFAERVTVLTQRAHVFDATIRENVTLFDPDISDERVWDVLGQLGAAAWIADIDGGLDTRVGAGGRALSEGELQLLNCARALIRSETLLIIDEGAARFDEATEAAWGQMLDVVRRGRTVVMVEHRRHLLDGFDDVLEIADGRVVDRDDNSAVDVSRLAW